MDTDASDLSPEMASGLVTAADKVWAAKPWKSLENEDIFALEDPALDGLWAVSVMGAGKEYYGLNFFQGEAGVALLAMILDDAFGGEEDQIEAWTSLSRYSLEFAPKRELAPDALDLLRQAGVDLTGKGRRRWPEFRRQRPHRPPAPLTPADVDRVIALLEAFLGASAVIEQDPEVIAWDPWGLDDEMTDGLMDFLAGAGDSSEAAKRLTQDLPAELFKLPEEGEELDDEDRVDFPQFPVWQPNEEAGSFVRRDLEAPHLPLYELTFSADTERVLAERMNRPPAGIWEIGVSMLGVVPDENGDGEPVYAEVMILAEATTGMILAATPGPRNDRATTVRDLLSSALEASEALPSTLGCGYEGLYRTLSAFCEKYGVEMEDETSPALAEALAHLRERFGG